MGNKQGTLAGVASPKGPPPSIPPKPDLHRTQPIARGVVALCGNTSRAGISAGFSKFVEIQYRRAMNAELAAVLTPGQAVCSAVATGTTVATIGVGAIDTVFEKVFAEAKGRETWVGAVKRNTPGLAFAVGATFVTAATLPEALFAYTTYKVVSKGLHFLETYGKDSKARFFDYQLVWQQAKSTFDQLKQTVAGRCARGTPVADKSK